MYVFVNDGLVPLRIQTLLSVFGPSFILGTANVQHTTRGQPEARVEDHSQLNTLHPHNDGKCSLSMENGLHDGILV